MPLKNGALTSGEKAVAEALAATGSLAYARAKSRLSPNHVARVAARPAVQAEIARIQTERLFSEALPAAVDCLVSIRRSDKAPAGARVQAAKVVLDRTLGSDEAAKAKDPAEMTPEELAGAIAELEAVAAGKAKVVSASTIDDAGEGDIFG